jgi:hypothetical protein
MSAPLLFATMLLERRAARRATPRRRLARFAVAVLAGAAVMALSAPAVAGTQ